MSILETFPDKEKKLYKRFSKHMKLYKVITFNAKKLYIAEFDDIEVGVCSMTNKNLLAITKWCKLHKNDFCEPVNFGATQEEYNEDYREEYGDLDEEYADKEDLTEDMQTIMRMNKEDKDEEFRQEERENWL